MRVKKFDGGDRPLLAAPFVNLHVAEIPEEALLRGSKMHFRWQLIITWGERLAFDVTA